MLRRRQYLSISLLFLTLLVLLSSQLIGSKFLLLNQLFAILFTVPIQIVFILKIKNRYKTSNLYFLHPIFYINAAIILYSYAPFIFFLFNQDYFYKSNIFEDSFYPLIIFCLAIISFNFVTILFDKGLIKPNKTFDVTKLLSDLSRNDFQIWVIIYIIIWIIRVFSIFTGTYWHSFVTEQVMEQRTAFSNITSTMSFFTTAITPIAWFIFSSLYFGKYKLSKRYKILFVAFLILEMIFYFPSGSKLAVLIPLIVYFCTGFILNQNVRKQFAVFLIVVILAFPLYSAFRVGSKFNLKTAEQIHLQSEKGYLFSAIRTFFERSDNFSSYFIFTGQEVHFLKGETYFPALFAPIPRPLWPGKPVETDCNKIGREYGLIDIFDYMTSPGIGPWGEAYLNFGYTGVLLIGIVMSLFSLALFRYMLKNRNTLIIALNFYSVIYYFTLIHGFWGGYFANVIKIIMFFAVISIIIKTVQKRVRNFIPQAVPGQHR
jgi:oligosaccharide repeat unit polymerase